MGGGNMGKLFEKERLMNNSRKELLEMPACNSAVDDDLKN